MVRKRVVREYHWCTRLSEENDGQELQRLFRDGRRQGQQDPIQAAVTLAVMGRLDGDRDHPT